MLCKNLILLKKTSIHLKNKVFYFLFVLKTKFLRQIEYLEQTEQPKLSAFNNHNSSRLISFLIKKLNSTFFWWSATIMRNWCNITN